jgi:hypothetical protein
MRTVWSRLHAQYEQRAGVTFEGTLQFRMLFDRWILALWSCSGPKMEAVCSSKTMENSLNTRRNNPKTTIYQNHSLYTNDSIYLLISHVLCKKLFILCRIRVQNFLHLLYRRSYMSVRIFHNPDHLTGFDYIYYEDSTLKLWVKFHFDSYLPTITLNSHGTQLGTS